MEYNAESPSASKYIRIAGAMGVNTDDMTEAEGVQAAIDAVRTLSVSIDIPQKLHEMMCVPEVIRVPPLLKILKLFIGRLFKVPGTGIPLKKSVTNISINLKSPIPQF